MTPKLFLTLVIMLSPVVMIIMSMISVEKLKLYTTVKSQKFKLELMPKINLEIFEDISRKLELKGFEHDNDYKVSMGEMNIVNFTKRFFHKELATEATITYVEINISENVNRGKQVIKDINKYTFKITTNFKDDYKIVTRDGNDVYLLKEENVLINEIKNIGDINGSITKHLGKVKNLSKEKVLKCIDENKDYGIQLEEEYKSMYEEQTRYGILKYCSKEGCYKFTLKGIIKGSFIILKASFKSSLNIFKSKKNPFMHKQDITLVEKGNPSDIASKFLRGVRLYVILIVITFLLRWLSSNL